MTDAEPNMKALRREWLAARVMGAMGALLLTAIAAVIGATLLSGPVTPPVTQVPPAASLAPGADADARRQEDIALCDAALSTAQTQGILPAFAARDGDTSIPGDKQGRYICRAKTDAAKYDIAFDLACTHLDGANCIVLYSVAQDGGGVLYQRH